MGNKQIKDNNLYCQVINTVSIKLGADTCTIKKIVGEKLKRQCVKFSKNMICIICRKLLCKDVYRRIIGKFYDEMVEEIQSFISTKLISIYNKLYEQNYLNMSHNCIPYGKEIIECIYLIPLKGKCQRYSHIHNYELAVVIASGEKFHVSIETCLHPGSVLYDTNANIMIREYKNKNITQTTFLSDITYYVPRSHSSIR